MRATYPDSLNLLDFVNLTTLFYDLDTRSSYIRLWRQMVIINHGICSMYFTNQLQIVNFEDIMVTPE